LAASNQAVPGPEAGKRGLEMVATWL